MKFIFANVIGPLCGLAIMGAGGALLFGVTGAVLSICCIDPGSILGRF